MSTSSTLSVVALVAEIDSYIRQCGGPYSAWYCGIACEPRNRMFSDHCVHELLDAWIFRSAGSEQAARRVEMQFLAKGCKGGGSGGDCNTRFVYVYRIRDTTKQ